MGVVSRRWVWVESMVGLGLGLGLELGLWSISLIPTYKVYRLYDNEKH